VGMWRIHSTCPIFSSLHKASRSLARTVCSTGCGLTCMVSAGREKNPKFIAQVAAGFDKEDNIVVVFLMNSTHSSSD
jgi:hypothetical protein